MIQIIELQYSYALLLNGQPVMSSACSHVCERVERLLLEAQKAEADRALKILIEDIGFCPSNADLVYSQLTSQLAN